MGIDTLFPEFAGQTGNNRVDSSGEKKKRNSSQNPTYQIWAYYCTELKNDPNFSSIELPKTISGINAGCLKNLIKEYSLPTLRLIIKCIIMDWPAFAEHFKVRANFPELRLITYFREKISFAATSGSGFFTPSHRFSKYAQYFENQNNAR